MAQATVELRCVPVRWGMAPASPLAGIRTLIPTASWHVASPAREVLIDKNGVKLAQRCHPLRALVGCGRSRMKAWWQLPNSSRASDLARWTLASCGAATVAWAFVEGDPVSPEKKCEAAPGPAASPEEVARWMRRASVEGTARGTLAAALAQVGPWAAEQTARDNDVPARVPPRA